MLVEKIIDEAVVALSLDKQRFSADLNMEESGTTLQDFPENGYYLLDNSDVVYNHNGYITGWISVNTIERWYR